MSGRHVFEYGDLLAIHFNNRTRRLRLYSYNHIIGRMDFQDIRHIRESI